MNGIITDLQRFSLNDGPGIRTTIFFKGCNMRCAWCHNPETISMKKEICYSPDNCINCFKCINVCIPIAHKKLGGSHKFFPNLCVKCGKCVKVCFAEAMSMPGRTVTVEQLMREIVQDVPYYRDSDGGVTLSGGEVFCQTEFAEALIDACIDRGIPSAVETNLSFPFEKMEPLFRKLALIMFDIKLFDEEEHRKWTGIDNRKILENAKRLSGLDIPLIVRTPLIPGVTDSEENLRQIAGFVGSLKHVQAYELLNFNPLGMSKYHNLNLETAFAAAKPLSRERLEQIRVLLSDTGVPVAII